jgi:hypothetical protein
MEHSRDSLAWRNLAVTFGSGLALGVAMKLTQKPTHHAVETHQPINPSPESERAAGHSRLDDRLSEIEERLLRFEKSGVAAPAGPANSFDQKVLETVVNALDARLREQSSHMERRLTELEAKFTIDLKTLHQQDHTIVSSIQGHIAEVHGRFQEEMTAARKAAAEEITAIHNQIAVLKRGVGETATKIVEERVAEAMKAQLAPLREEMAKSAAEMVDQKTEDALTAHLIPMHAELMQTITRSITEAVNGQVGPLRASVAESVTQSVEGRIAPVRAELAETIRKSVEERVADAVAAQLTLLRAQVTEGVTAQLTEKLPQFLGELRTTLMQVLTAAVDERVANAVTAGMDPLRAEAQRWVAATAEERVAAELGPLRTEFAAVVKKAVSDQVEDAMRGQIEPLRSQLDNKDREIAELQDCLADHDRTMFEAVSAIGETCREAVSRISGPRVPPAAAAAPAQVDMQGDGEPVETAAPGFAQTQNNSKLWRVPLVSGLVLAICGGGVAIFHYL